MQKNIKVVCFFNKYTIYQRRSHANRKTVRRKIGSR